MHNLFSQLPIEALFQIYSYLSPEDTVTIGKVNRNSRRIVLDQLFWKAKYRLHFPHLFDAQMTRSVKEEVNWHAEFRLAYESEYKLLSTDKRILFSLVKEGNLRDTKKQLSLSDVDIQDSHGKTLVEWAWRSANQAQLDNIYHIVLQHFYNMHLLEVFAVDAHQRTILHWAILCRQQHDVISDLFQRGALPNSPDDKGNTPLVLAAGEGQITNVRTLLFFGENIDASLGGTTPLMAAVMKGHKNVVDLLLERGAQVFHTLGEDLPPFEAGETALHLAIRTERLDIVESLLANGATVEEFAHSANTPLISAAKTGNVAMAAMLIRRGANINARSGAGATALMFAIRNGHKAIVDLLLQHHANVSLPLQRAVEYHAPIEASDTPLHAAIRLGRIDIVEALLDNGSTIEEVAAFQNTPLITAAKCNKPDIVALLLRRNANVNARSTAGATALLFAVEKGHQEIVEVLLAHHADVTIPLQMGVAQHNPVVSGDTPLHAAAKHGRYVIGHALLKHNANIESFNAWQETPVKVAKTFQIKSELQLIDYLVKRSRKEEYTSSFTLFCYEFFTKPFTLFGHKFNISKTDKLAAANALKDVIFDGRDKTCLDAHSDALHNGELGSIYRRLIVS